ncbi:hypothetical protein Y1Q_0011765 [Alligator mississippiensis]|uniref:Uncharacterized protein n=1 Tax=Alligator mississippiensis TaxID=8496 RepID=A0A151M172_ALLMI|nr:hypothetical protein Y1Q_0011765 [Alligator mississippiensis]
MGQPLNSNDCNAELPGGISSSNLSHSGDVLSACTFIGEESHQSCNSFFHSTSCCLHCKTCCGSVLRMGEGFVT